jgi:tetratricopeptide (TPR) repeat protein
MRPPRSKVLTAMAKPGRNDPCHCGSGNKYKKCCLGKDESASKAQLGSAKTRQELTEDAARLAVRAAAHLPGIHQLKTAIAARLGMSDDDLQRYDQLMDASNAAVALVRAGKLDEAEAAARDLLARFPDEHDGWDRLGMVHEARGENGQAATCYRKVLDVIRQSPDDYDAALEQKFVTLVDRLDPPPTSS